MRVSFTVKYWVYIYYICFDLIGLNCFTTNPPMFLPLEQTPVRGDMTELPHFIMQLVNVDTHQSNTLKKYRTVSYNTFAV